MSELRTPDSDRRSPDSDPRPPDPQPRLRDQAARAFGWVAAARLLERVIGVGRIVVLARLLAPQDFGAFGIALLALGMLERLSRPGLGIALVQRREDVTRYLDAVWTVLVLRSLAMAALLYASRDLVAGFFESPQAAPLITGVATATAIGGFTSLGLHLLQRELRLERRFTAIAASSFADLLVTIPLAFALRDAMALVYGMIARNVVLVVASFLVHPHRPRPTLHWGPLRDLKDFAVQGALHSWLFFLVEQGDDAFVGRIMGESALGIYLITYRVANILTQELARILAEVTLPVFSRVQDELDLLARGLREGVGAICAVVLPGAALLLIVAHPFIETFLGAQWLEGVSTFQVLLVFGVFRVMSQSMEAGLMARGDMRFLTRVLIVQLAVAVAAVIPLGLRFGLPGVASAIVLSQLVSFVISLTRMATVVGHRRLQLLGAARGPVLGVALAAAVTSPLVFGPLAALGSNVALLLLGALVFTPLYLVIAMPRLRVDVPTVMEVTVDRLWRGVTRLWRGLTRLRRAVTRKRSP